LRKSPPVNLKSWRAFDENPASFFKNPASFLKMHARWLLNAGVGAERFHPGG